MVLNLNTEKAGWPGLMEAYRDWLPITKKTPIITLQEGNTPLIPLKSIENGKAIKQIRELST